MTCHRGTGAGYEKSFSLPPSIRWGRMRALCSAAALLAVATWAACGGTVDIVHGGVSSSSSATGALCIPGETRACYSGPAGTKGVGSCAPGVETCEPDGAQFSLCAGQILPAFDDCVTAADEDCDGVPVACTGALLWAHTYDTPLVKGLMAEDYLPLSVTIDRTGAVIVAGAFLDPIDFGGGPLHASDGAPNETCLFAAKWSPEGKPLWSKTWGPGRVYGVAADSAGNILLTGTYGSTAFPDKVLVDFGGGALAAPKYEAIFVAKLDPDGKHLWSFGMPDAHAEAHTIAVDGHDEVLVAGWHAGTLPFDGGSVTTAVGAEGTFAVKLDEGGHFVWGFDFDKSADNTHVLGIAGDASGRATIVGAAWPEVAFNGIALKTLGLDALVGEVDASGNTPWAKAFGDAQTQVAADVAVDPSGNPVIVGRFSGALDFGAGLVQGDDDMFVTKLDPDGHGLWTRGFADHFSVSKRVAADPAGHVVFGGSVELDTDFGGGMLPSAGMRDGFVAKLDGSSGKHLWSRRFGDAKKQAVWDVATGPKGEVVIVGTFEGAINLGLGSLTTTSGALFVAKLAP